MKKVLIAVAMFVMALNLAASVSWGATPDATWEGATWEGLGDGGIW